MGGGEFLDQLEHVVVLPAEDPVAAHLRALRRRERHRDGIVMHIQPDVEDAAAQRGGHGRGRPAAHVPRGRHAGIGAPGIGPGILLPVLPLDSVWVTE